MSVAGMTNAQLGYFLDACHNLKPYEKSGMEEAQARIADGAIIPGWSIGETETKRKVLDSPALARAIIAEGADTYDVIGHMNIGIGYAEKALAKATGLKGAALKDRFAEISAGLVGKGEPQPKLVKEGV